MRKKNKIIAICIVVLLIVVSFTFIYFYNKKKSEIENIDNKNKIVATSIYGNVYKKDIDEYISNLEILLSKKIDSSKFGNKEIEMIAKEIVVQKRLLREANSNNISELPEFKRRMTNLRAELLKEIYLSKISNDFLTKEYLDKKYNEKKESFKDKKEIKIKYISADNENAIKTAKKELLHDTFDNVAKKYNDAFALSSTKDYILEENFSKEFKEVLNKLFINEVSEPFKSENSWFIVLKEDERKVKVPSFKEMENTLRNEGIQEFIKQYSNETSTKSEFKYIK